MYLATSFHYQLFNDALQFLLSEFYVLLNFFFSVLHFHSFPTRCFFVPVLYSCLENFF